MHQQWKDTIFQFFATKLVTTWIQDKIPPLPLYYVIVWSIQQSNCITQGHTCSIPTFRYYEEVILRHGAGLHSLASLAGPNDYSSQFRPSCPGMGLVQVLARFCTPPPHVTLQSYHSHHSVTTFIFQNRIIKDSVDHQASKVLWNPSLGD